MNVALESLAAGAWDREPVYRRALHWSRRPGVRFHQLTSSQMANLERAVRGVDSPDVFLRTLEGWLEERARRGDEVSVWRRAGEPNPLTSEIPRLFREALEATLGSRTPADRAFDEVRRIKPGSADELLGRRKLEILKETLAALAKCHRAKAEVDEAQVALEAEKNHGK